VDDTESGTGVFFRHAALHDSRALNWEHLSEFKSRAEILAAFARDRYGLAVTSLPQHRREVREGRDLRALRPRVGGGTPFEATRANIMAGDYPLGRDGYAYLNRVPGQPVKVPVLEFLQYVLSEEGQSVLRSPDDYLPLPLPTAAEEAKKLR